MSLNKNLSLEEENLGRTSILDDYSLKLRGKRIFLLSLFILLIFVMAYSAGTGVISISVKQVFQVIYSRLLSKDLGLDQSVVNIIMNIRLPRIIMGMIVGMGLGAAGAMMQTILQNPMASPFTLGISSGAGLGASLAIIYGIGPLPLSGKYLIIANAFIFAMSVSLLILLIARLRGNRAEDLVLAGIALMNLFNAITTLLTYFADVYSSKEIMYWQVGSLGKADWEGVKIISIIFILVFPYFIWKSSDLNKMAFGDEVAKSLGIDVERLRVVLMILMSLLVASITAFTGMISFIGLVVPHLIRLVVGADNKYLIPGSALGGAILLIAADTLALNIIAPNILPVGVLTAFIGSPLFVFMILKNRRVR